MHCTFRYSFLLFLFFASLCLHAQKETNTWYFGSYLGLEFTSGTAVPLNDGKINTMEGVATISSPNGKLLFYTDGVRVWNRLHQVMPRGTGLFGDVSSTQSAIIVPKIGDTTRYYIFTVDVYGGRNGLQYSMVNMALDNGNGDIETKNVPVISNVTEKLTAVRHCNKRDIWVIVHKDTSNTYYAFLVDPAGIKTAPVISHTGSVAPPFNGGYLKASPDGKKIAAVMGSVNTDISDFNNATGVVSNSYGLFLPTDPRYRAYGVEFSPDSRLVYTTASYFDGASQWGDRLLQYDVSLSSPAAVRASIQVISDYVQKSSYEALQLGPDGKMYMAKIFHNEIAAVNDPNVYGPGCGFVSSAVKFTLPNQVCKYGLPTFVQSYFQPFSFTYKLGHPCTTATFSYHPAPGAGPVLWNFGDPVSGASNTSTLTNPTHSFSSTGQYNVQLIRLTDCGPDTIQRTIQVDTVAMDLGPDTLVCGSSSILLHPSTGGSPNSFLWQDSSGSTTYLAKTPGLYWVEVRNPAGCSARDSIRVDLKSAPVFNLGGDTALCQNDVLVLNSGAAGANSYLWNTGAAVATLQASSAGLYWAEVRNPAGCSARDSINVTIKPIPVFSLGADTTICQNDVFVLNAGATNAGSYLWNIGTTASTLPVSAAGLYWCEAFKEGCTFRDSVSIATKPSPLVNLGNDVTVCEGTTVPLDATYLNSTYLWQDGSTNPTYQVTRDGTYSVHVNYNGCTASDTIRISYAFKPRFTLGPDQMLCPGNTIVLKPVLNPSWQLLWQDGSMASSFAVTQPGTYQISATNQCGSTTDEIVISGGICKVYVPTGFTPNQDGKNDLFKVLGVETVTSFSLRIFNRWGEVVFETSDKSKGWDGKFRGVDIPTGVFVYVLKYSDINSPDPQHAKGTFVLVR